jgi:hypothetical protein
VYATSGIGTEQWTFGQQLAAPDSSGNTAGVAYRLLVATVTNDRLALQHLEVRYVNGSVRTHSRRCAAPCASATLTRHASGTGITLDLASTVFRHDAIGTTLSGAPTADLAFTGSLSADWPGATLFLSQLPQGTSGNLTVDGVAATPRYASTTYNTRPATPSEHPFITLGLGHVITAFKVNIPGSAVAQDILYSPGTGGSYFAAVPTGSLVQTATSHTVSFNQLALPLSGNSGQQVVLNGSFTAGRSSGSLSWSGGSFAPLTDTIVAANRDITYTFTGFTAGSSFQPNLTVKLRGGQVQEALLISGTQDLRCAATATGGVPACQGTVAASADGRTLSFGNLVLGAFGSPGTTVTLNGQLGSAGI